MHSSLALTLKDRMKTAPLVAGTIINGGPYKRKLNMLRSDLFTLLSISESAKFMTTKKGIAKLKRGVGFLTEKNQEVPQEAGFLD